MATKQEWVRYADQLGYLALPEHGTKPLPAIVVIHDVLGLDGHVQDVTRRLAAAGYAALAPDLFAVAGERPAPLRQERIEEAMGVLGRLPPAARFDRDAREAGLAQLPEAERLRVGESLGQVLAFATPGRLEGLVDSLRRAVRHLRCECPSTRGQRVGCMGEELSLLLACQEPELSGAVVYYGGVASASKLATVRCPVIAFYGANDAHAGTAIATLAEGMGKTGCSLEYSLYEGAGRGFFNDMRPSYYDVQASRDAFARTLMFFLKTLAQ
jgi:carboxymethylenebutenolidase